MHSASNLTVTLAMCLLASGAAEAGKEQVYFSITLTEARSAAKVDSFTVKQSVKPMQVKLDRGWVKSWSTSGDADARPTPAGTSDLTMKRGTGPVASSSGIDRLIYVSTIKGSCQVGKRYAAATMEGGGNRYEFSDVRITDCTSAGPEEHITFVYGKMIVK